MRLIAFALVSALLLAGCSGGSDGDSSSSATTGSTTGTTSHSTTHTGTGTTTTGTSTSTTSTGPVGNHAPGAALSVDVASGTAPLSVNFTVDVADNDAGDSVTWSLSFGDSSSAATGSEAHKVVAHTYAAAGNFTAKLTATDSKGATGEKTVAVTATNGGGGGGGFTPVSFSQLEALPCGPCDQTSDASGCVGWLQGVQAVDCGWTDLPAAASGHPWTATGTVDVGVMFYAACDPSSAILLFVDGNLGDEAGTVPDGALCAVLFGAEAPAQTVTFDVT